MDQNKTPEDYVQPQRSQFTTEDREEASAYLSLLLSRDLDILEPGPFRLTANVTKLDLISVMTLESSAPWLVRTASVSSYSLVRMEEGIVDRSWDGHQVIAGPGQGVLTTPEKELLTRATPFRVTAISISAEHLAIEAEQQIGDQVLGPLEILEPIDLDSSTRLGQRINYLNEAVDAKGGLVWNVNYHLMRVDFQRNLIATLIEGTPNSYQDLLARGRHASNATRQVIRLKEYLYDHLRQPVTLGAMAAALGAPARTLIENCQRAANASPTSILREMRLNAVRRRLERPQPHDTVGRVAAEYCFHHGGRFARYYEARYGETPNTTLHRGRRREGIAP